MNALSAGDGDAYRAAMVDVEREASLIFTALGQEPWSWPTGKAFLGQLYRRGPRGLGAFIGEAMQTQRAWLEREFRSDLVRALLAPWVLHTGMGPDDAMSALMTKVIMFTLEAAGIPFVVGGSSRIVDAFRTLIEANGSMLEIDADVAHVILENGNAIGVETTTGRRISARQAVICNVTPTQLYERLLAGRGDPGARSRHVRAPSPMAGPTCRSMSALSAPPEWHDPKLAGVAVIHLTPGLDGVSRAVRMPSRDCCRPRERSWSGSRPRPIRRAALLDDRCSGSSSRNCRVSCGVTRRARSRCPPRASGPPSWQTAYAHRVLRRLGRHIVNLERATLKTAVLSPADLERHNVNLVGGDPYSGACTLGQFHCGGHFQGAATTGRSSRASTTSGRRLIREPASAACRAIWQLRTSDECRLRGGRAAGSARREEPTTRSSSGPDTTASRRPSISLPRGGRWRSSSRPTRRAEPSKTREVTVPGFRHDLFAMNLSPFAGSPFFAAYKDTLLAHGLRFSAAADCFATPFPDGSWLGVSQDLATTTAAYRHHLVGRCGALATHGERLRELTAPHIFALLASPIPSFAAAKSVWKAYRVEGRAWLSELARLFGRFATRFPRRAVRERETEGHDGGLGHASRFPSGLRGLRPAALPSSRWPIRPSAWSSGTAAPIPWSRRWSAHLRSLGGELHLGRAVQRIETITGTALAGVRLSDGEVLTATPRRDRQRASADSSSVTCSGKDRRRTAYDARLASFRAGPGTMMIHLALSAVSPIGVRATSSSGSRTCTSLRASRG